MSMCILVHSVFFFFSSRRRHTRLQGDWSSDVCSSDLHQMGDAAVAGRGVGVLAGVLLHLGQELLVVLARELGDRKSTRLNSSHLVISYAVFCLKKKKNTDVSYATVIYAYR